MKKALFLDLDHTLIRPRSGKTFPIAWDDWEFMPNVVPRLRGWLQYHAKQSPLLVIVTNQGGVAAGYQTKPDVQRRLKDVLGQLRQALRYRGVYAYVSYLDDYARKPLPGMAYRAALDLRLDLPASEMVGDMPADKEFAQNAGLDFTWASTFFRL